MAGGFSCSHSEPHGLQAEQASIAKCGMINSLSHPSLHTLNTCLHT